MAVLHLNYTAFAKMRHYVKEAKGEISGFGRLKSDHQKNEYTLRDAFILSQQCSGASTDLTDEALTDFLVTLAEKNLNPADYNFWWHSHATFGVFWSGTDEATIRGLTVQNPWVSLCMNKAGDMIARIDYMGKRANLTVVVEPTASQSLRPFCRRQVRRKVMSW